MTAGQSATFTARTDAVFESGYAHGAVALAFALTLARLVALAASQAELGPDEAQYWFWSLTLDWGYFTKPPMIAWVIAGASAACGESEACLRFPAPLFHGGAMVLVFVIGRTLYDARTGFWSAIGYGLMPAVSFGSGIITTDTPLIFFWCLALAALLKAMRSGGLGWWALAGAALGAGMLAKYAMAYFLIGLALAWITSAAVRREVTLAGLAMMGALALAVIAPNLVWNAMNDFATVQHVGANANLGADLFNPEELADFLLAQFGVFGPVPFAALLAGLVLWPMTRRDARVGEADRLLLCFALPVLLIVSGQALLSRANANWAVAAYPAATVLVTAWLLRWQRRPLVLVSTALHGVLGVMLYVLAANPALADSLGRANDFKRVRGWETLGIAVAMRAGEAPYDAILSDDREIMATLLYYARPRSMPILAAPPPDGVPGHHFELTAAWTPAAARRVLFVTASPEGGVAPALFARVEPVGEATAILGGGRNRTLRFFRAEDPR